MNLYELIKQCAEDGQKWFPDNQGIPYMTLCLAGEVGEIANIVKKVERGTLRMEDAMDTLPEEIIDALVYLCSLMGHEQFKNIDWDIKWFNKRRDNEMRFGDL